MQGDLISKQKVIEIIEEYYEEAEHYGFASAIADLVEAVRMLDVAYDVEKVVAELEEELEIAKQESKRCLREHSSRLEIAEAYEEGIEDSLYTVRNGGKE